MQEQVFTDPDVQRRDHDRAIIDDVRDMANQRLIEHRIPLKPMGHMNKLVVVLPILCYAVLPIGDLAMGYPEATKVIAPFSMGIAVIAALMRMGEPADEAATADQAE